MVNENNIVRIFPAIAAVILVALLFLYFNNRTERIILKRQRELIALFSKSGPEKELAALSRAQEISTYFQADVKVDLTSYATGQYNRREMAGLIYHFRSMVTKLSIDILDQNIQIDSTRKQAVLLIMAKAKAEYSGTSDNDLREIEITWIKDQRKWIIAKAVFVSSIRQPGSL